ncbi:Iaa7p [Datura stramonium]|uniref:Auxin-responsive protein n=1 Tax=Datura stramonium TaxID=4076 RepID=A0ABS8TGK2_DATST|nr:Iaa7p [Datura stramonium]
MDLNLKETGAMFGAACGGELLRDQNIKKRGFFFETVDLKLNLQSTTHSPQLAMKDQNVNNPCCNKPPPKAQVVGWPPVRSFRKKRNVSKREE